MHFVEGKEIASKPDHFTWYVSELVVQIVYIRSVSLAHAWLAFW